MQRFAISLDFFTICTIKAPKELLMWKNEIRDGFDTATVEALINTQKVVTPTSRVDYLLRIDSLNPTKASTASLKIDEKPIPFEKQTHSIRWIDVFVRDHFFKQLEDEASQPN